MADGFYRRWGKRWLDVGVSLVGLIVFFPLFTVTALLIRWGSPGPVFFRQERVGQGGRVFRLLKFRSMVPGAEQEGPRITASGDPRLTPAGRWLRRFKIDELPQLWNVLKGEMSLVGPRPELAAYVAGYTPAHRKVLTVRPGITDPASLRYRNEEELLAGRAAREQYYREVILPDKLALNLAYIEKISLAYDLGLIVQTLGSVLRAAPAPGEKAS